MNLLDETRYRLNACRMGLASGFGDRQSLRNQMMRVDQRISELTPFAKEIDAHPDDTVRNDEDIIALMQEYHGLLTVRDSARQFLGIKPPAEVEPVKKDNQGFKAFIKRLLG